MKQITFFISLFLFTLGSFGQDLKITEIMYNPSGGDNPWEWIEIYNSGETAIDLSGYVLDDASGTALSIANISNGILEPQTSAILFDADDITEIQFREVWGTVNLIAVSKWSTLGNTGDTIGIWDSFLNYDGDQRTQLNTAAHVEYDNTDNGWPNDDGRASIYLIALEFDTAIGENWSLSTDGAETPLNTTYVSNELHDNSGTDIGSPGIPAGLEDLENPIIICSEDVTMAIQEGSCETSFPIEFPKATDNSEDELTFEGLRSDEQDLIASFPLGETMITWTAIDASGNSSEPCIQIINIIDEIDPVISCSENIKAESEDGTPVILEIENAMATDFCDGDIEIVGLRSDEEPLEAPYPVGETTILWQATDASGNIAECMQTIVVDLIPSNENDDFQVLSFTLVNADTNEDLFTITEGMQIDINTLPTLYLDIRANTTDEVESVRFSLDGTLTTSRTESLLPYALFQDLPIGNYMGNDFSVGLYTVQAIPYTEDSLRGTAGTPFSINFELTDSCQNFELSLEVITDILTCQGTDGAIIVLPNGGVEPINYSWSHDSLIDSPMATDLVAGEYVVIATDANNCTAELTVTLNDPELPEVSLLSFESVLDNEEPIVLFEGQPFGGTYSGVGVTEGEFDPSEGAGIYDITYTYVDEATGCENSATATIEVLPSEELTIESFTLVNADTNEDIFDLVEGMKIDVNSLPTLHLDIRANTSEKVESVKLSISGTITSARTESLVPYALFQDLPIGDYKGNDFIVGEYSVVAVPYSEDAARGSLGSSFRVNFELVDPTLSVTEFMLVNAETNEDLFLIGEGMVIDVSDLPTLHLDIRANTTDDVESVRLSLEGAITTARTESLVPYALFQDLPIGDYKGNDFIVGQYAVRGIPFSEDSQRGEVGSALTVNFELIDAQQSGKSLISMIISPNPANIKTSLSFDTPVNLLTIVIYDTHGRLVRSVDPKKIKVGETYQLEIESLQSGNYFVKAIDEKGLIHNGQMLVKKQ